MDWSPAVTLDLDTASTQAFAATVEEFKAWAATQPPQGPLALINGWYDVTPQMAQGFLRRNDTNRKVYLPTVKKYFNAMRAGEWHRTGQPLIFNQEGKAEDLQHRCWASLLGGVTFHSFIVTDSPVEKDKFAYIDDSKPRNAADALQTSGMNGLSAPIAAAIKLAWRYENGALTIMKQSRVREMSIPEILAYSRSHKEIAEAAHFLMTNHARAVRIIGNKGVAVFFAWKALELHPAAVVEDFLYPLGSGANLAEDSPVLALRARLNKEGEAEDLNQPRRLALLIKAFNMDLAGHTVGKRGLYVRDNEKFPRIEGPADLPVAAE
jgi:hypothetical protein